MKKIFILTLLACLLSSMLFAQTIQLIMSPNPSPYFSDWQNKTETARLIVNNTSQTSIDCKIKTQLFNGDDELVAETDFVKMPLLTLMPGISQFNAENIYPLEAVKTYGNSFNSMSSTGRIPDGNYRLCTDLVDPINGTPLTAQSPQCKMFRIIAYQAPVLIAPRENQIIPETEAKGIIFRWSPVAPSPNYIVTYRLQIWEVSDGQTNVDAVRYNWPIIEKDFRGILQTQWPFDFAPPEEGINYVWTITPLDNEERNLVDGYEFADPFGFRFTTGDVNPPMAIVKISRPPPNQLRMTDLWNFTLNNPTRKPLEVSLECKMTTQETHPIVIIIIIHLKPFTLPPGTTTFTYEDIKNGDIKFASDEWRDVILNTGNIPSGDYNICVSALDKEGKEIGKDCIEQEIASDEACKYLSVDFMEERKIYKGDSTAYQCKIVNNYKGKEEQNKPKTFRIKTNNDLYMSVSESASKKWKRTPSKFPPGSSEIVWTASSGDIPGGESNLGSILFANVKSGPISVQYEWLNKDDKVICSGTRTLDMTDLGTTQRVKLISPKNGEGINIDNPKFRWLNFKITNDREKFRLRIVEIIGNQLPEEAMQNSESFFDVWGELPSREGEMIYKYPESSPKFEAGKKYAWMIQCGDLRSSISIFDRWGLKSTTLRCDCGTWSPININKVNYDCGGRIDWKCNELINFSSAYQCIPNDTACKAKTSWEITRNGQAVQSGSGSEGAFTPTSNGIYTLSLNAICNGIKCEPCVYTFVVEGCPECTCKEKNWGVIQNITYHTDNGGTSQSIECLSTLKNKIIAGSIFEYATTPYNCLKEKCKAEYSWEIINVSSGVVHSSGTALSLPINFTAPTSAGDYQLVVTPICGNTICGSCGFYFSTSQCSQSALPAPTANPGTGIQETQFTANWTAVAGATGYFIDVSTNPAFASYVGGYQNLSIGIANSFVVTGLNCNTSYFYRIRAIDECGVSANSNYKRVNTLIPSLSITAIAASGIQANQFTAKWNTVPGATAYYIDVSTNTNFSSYINGYSNLSIGTAASKFVFGLNCNTTYYYRIRALSACGGQSENSNIISVSTTLPVQAPPIATAATQTATLGFMAHWTSVNGASGYYFDLSMDADFSSFVPNGNNVDAGMLTQVDLLGIIGCTTYYYRVRAVNACGGISNNSNTIAVQTFPPEPHGSWIKGPGIYSFTVGAFGTTANVNGCPGQSIPITMELWGAGGAGGDGEEGRNFGGNGGGGGGGGGYAITTIIVTVPSTGTRLYYVGVGKGGIAGASLHDGINHRNGFNSQIMLGNTSTMVLKARGGLEGRAGSHYGINSIAWSGGGAGGSGTINNWSGSSGTNGAIVSGCNGGAGGLGGAGGGPGRTGPGYYNDGGNGGHGGYFRSLIFPTCIDHSNNYLLSPGAAGGDGRVKISW
ncbi:MAG: hypothetical protein GXO88_02540 [Chlorobi bacterium]|nr:hypothetical protein [Chlorobiota bacterium]